MLRAKGRVLQVEVFASNSAIEVIVTIYAHASLDEKRKALGKLGEALS